VAAAGETTGPSRMEQSVDVGGALLQLVPRATDLRRDRDFRFEPSGRLQASRSSPTEQAGPTSGQPLLLPLAEQ
jgi:hypothetical protein